MNEVFDLGVIGAGPGGYVCAIKAAQLGIKVVCFDENALGGTCLNRGCIPSKFLLHASHLYDARKSLGNFGVTCQGMSVDLPKMQEMNTKNISEFQKGIAGLFKKNKVTFVGRRAQVMKSANARTADNCSHHTIQTDDGQVFLVKNVVLATGSSVSGIPNINPNGKNVITSDEALFLQETPNSVAIIGGGVIGVELGSVWSRLGTQVTVVEYLDEILPGLDGEVRKTAHKIFAKQGLEFRVNHKALAAELQSDSLTCLRIEDNSSQELSEVKADLVIVCAGRRPNVDADHLRSIGVEVSERGIVQVDGNLQTTLPGLYAIGDIVPGPMLAHKAEEDGVFVAEKLAGQQPHLDYNLVPSVVYTHPELAMIGKTEEALKRDSIPYKIGKFPFMANSRAKTVGDFEGFVKVLTHKEYDTIIGVHIIGPQAGTLIGQMSVAMHYGASAEDIARICHSHPDLNETIKEACLAAHFKPIHM